MSEASAYAMLFVLTCSLAGTGIGAAFFYRGEKLALYEVVRVDDVKPGEFENAIVIAGGTALARAAVAHLLPKGAKVEAARVEVNAAQAGGTKLLATYFDEREPEAAPVDDDVTPLI
ncbi:hypothetical protein OG548_08165 [Streptomyces sp. NBC_01356]|uniref:hypothetical protein n=1 Tax=Streptomyces sp. NBC_01356 TaxID=2903836 RepID=UPI002E343F6A|nr:hypothetical protein [Streptomyces sp. NBC_01356]